MITPIWRPAVAQRVIDFMLDRSLRLVFRREDEVAFFPHGFFLRPAEDTLGAVAPEGDDVRRVEQKHRVVASAFDEEAEPFFARPEERFRLLVILDVGRRA